MAQATVNNVSSAKSVGVKFDACGRSFTYKANSRGPSDEPWGNPRLTPWVVDLYPNNIILLSVLQTEVKVSRNSPERRSGKRIIAGTAFRLEFLVGWYYDADATMAVPELY